MDRHGNFLQVGDTVVWARIGIDGDAKLITGTIHKFEFGTHGRMADGVTLVRLTDTVKVKSR